MGLGGRLSFNIRATVRYGRLLAPVNDDLPPPTTTTMDTGSEAGPPADRPRWLSFPPMTDRGLPIVDGAPACPFVAFEDDRDGRGRRPTTATAASRSRVRRRARSRTRRRTASRRRSRSARRSRTGRVARRRRPAPRSSTPSAGPEEPVSQSLPPRELEARHAPSTDTPPPLPPAAIRRATGRSRRRGRATRTASRRSRRRSSPRGRPSRPISAPPRRPPGALHRAGWPAAPPTAWRAATGRADEPVAAVACGVRAGVVRGARRRRPQRARPTPGRGGRRGRDRPPRTRRATTPPRSRPPHPRAGRLGRPAGRRRRPMGGNRAPRPSRRRIPTSCSGRPGRRRAATRRTRRCGPGWAALLRG